MLGVWGAEGELSRERVVSLPAFVVGLQWTSVARFWRIDENLNSSAGEVVFAPLARWSHSCHHAAHVAQFRVLAKS